MWAWSVLVSLWLYRQVLGCLELGCRLVIPRVGRVVVARGFVHCVVDVAGEEVVLAS